MYTRSTIRASKGDAALHARHTPERPRDTSIIRKILGYTQAHTETQCDAHSPSAAAGDAKEGSAPANFYVLCARAIPIPGCGGISVFRTVCSHGTRSAGAGVAREGDGDGDGGREYASDDERDSEETGDGGGGDGTDGVGDSVVRKGYGDGGGDGSPSDALAETGGALTTNEGVVVGPEVEPGERSVRLDGRRCWAPALYPPVSEPAEEGTSKEHGMGTRAQCVHGPWPIQSQPMCARLLATKERREEARSVGVGVQGVERGRRRLTIPRKAVLRGGPAAHRRTLASCTRRICRLRRRLRI